MDCSLPGSSVHGIFQARVLEWGAIAFSDYQQIFPDMLLNVGNTFIFRMDKQGPMAPHSSALAWKIPWMEEPGGLQSMELRRVGHD